jgi:hypothetical protein
MKYPRRFAFLAMCLCSISLVAQIAPATNGPQPATQNGSPTGPTAGKRVKPPFPLRYSYYAFILQKASDHDFIQQEIRDDPKRFDPEVELRNMAMYIDIRPDEYQTVLTYILPARDRLQENEREYTAAVSKFQYENGGGYNSSGKNPMPPEVIALGQEHGAIIDGTMANLKHELGDESFKKLDLYIRMYWGQGSAIPTKTKTTNSK